MNNLKYLVSHEDEAKKSLNKPYYTFFLFVNPTSGGNQAAILTKLDVIKVDVSLETSSIGGKIGIFNI